MKNKVVGTDGCAAPVDGRQIVTQRGQLAGLTGLLIMLKSGSLQVTATYRGEQQLAVRRYQWQTCCQARGK
jgi:hypothetical protein